MRRRDSTDWGDVEANVSQEFRDSEEFPGPSVRVLTPSVSPFFLPPSRFAFLFLSSVLFLVDPRNFTNFLLISGGPARSRDGGNGVS